MAAQASPTSIVPERHPGYEKHYLDMRKTFIQHAGLSEAGRNIVRDGYREQDGDVHQATIGGLLIERAGRFPKPGDVVGVDGLRLKVADARNARINQVRRARATAGDLSEPE